MLPLLQYRLLTKILSITSRNKINGVILFNKIVFFSFSDFALSEVTNRPSIYDLKHSTNSDKTEICTVKNNIGEEEGNLVLLLKIKDLRPFP